MFGVEKKLDFVRDEAKGIISKNKSQSKVLSSSNFFQFFRDIGSSFKLILQEKEIIVLALLQWAFVAIGYLVFIQFLDWIPDEIWHEIDKALEEDRDGPGVLLSLALFGWSLVVVLIVSYPIGLFNSAMAAVHVLKTIYGGSSLIGAIRIAEKNQFRIWAFSFVDAWITARAVFDRLPSKNNKRSLLDEVLYYAWKLGTMGIIPALVNGKGLIESGKQSLIMIKKHPLRAMGLRFGYSLLCWIVGVGSYIGAVFWMMHSNIEWGSDNWVFALYQWVFLPFVISIGIVTVLIRPFFMLGVARLYTDTFGFDEDHVEEALAPRGSTYIVIVFILLSLGLLALAFYGEELGIKDWVEGLARQDLQDFRNNQ